MDVPDFLTGSFHPEGYVTIVGSRTRPNEVGELLSDVAEIKTTQGWRVRSGGSWGSDEDALFGARRSPRFPQVKVEIYLPWGKFKRDNLPTLFADPASGIFDASKFENWEQAEAIALEARGSWDGLGQGGIKLHTRNAYQPLGRYLNRPSGSLVCYAKPVGKKGAVDGGTNTAVQIALRRNIRVINAYKDEDRRMLEGWVKTQREKHVEHNC